VKVRFLADADSGVQRREPSLDFLTAHAAGLRGLNELRHRRNVVNVADLGGLAPNSHCPLTLRANLTYKPLKRRHLPIDQ
jgi:hypothetical protein